MNCQPMKKNILIGAGAVLLTILGIQQLIINSQEMRVNGYVGRCIDELRQKEWWSEANAERRARNVNITCRQL